MARRVGGPHGALLGPIARGRLWQRRWPLLLLAGLTWAIVPPSWCHPNAGAGWASRRWQAAAGGSVLMLRRGAAGAGADAAPGPGGSTSNEEVGAAGGRVGLGRRLRDRLADSIAAQEAQVEAVPTEDQKSIQRQDVDLNGIDPLACLAGAVPVAALSYGFWKFTGSAAEWFLAHPIETDFYPVQRLGTAFQTAVVGVTSLAAGIFGFTSLGIFLLGARVALGVASGELDPTKESAGPRRQTTAERVRDVFLKDPVDVVMAARRTSGHDSSSAGGA